MILFDLICSHLPDFWLGIILQVGPGGSSTRHDGYCTVKCSPYSLLLLHLLFWKLFCDNSPLRRVRSRDMVRSIKSSCVMLLLYNLGYATACSKFLVAVPWTCTLAMRYIPTHGQNRINPEYVSCFINRAHTAVKSSIGIMVEESRTRTDPFVYTPRHDLTADSNWIALQFSLANATWNGAFPH